MHEPYPQGGEQPPEPAPPARPAPPRPVRTAVLLMYVGAAITALTLVVTVLTAHSIETALENRASYTLQQAHQFVVAATVAAVITLGLWLLMAWANRNGFAWGRRLVRPSGPGLRSSDRSGLRPFARPAPAQAAGRHRDWQVIPWPVPARGESR